MNGAMGDLTADYADETDCADELNRIRVIRLIRVIRGYFPFTRAVVF